MARVGGGVFPKALAQFEAHAFDNGPDGRDDTPDDIDLGLVPATWSLEEYAATYDDDDREVRGADRREDGTVHAERSMGRTRRGGAAGTTSATSTRSRPSRRSPSTGKPAKALQARAHLLVTVPLYMRWEPTERVR